jgi:hypothetical protein
MISKRLTNIFSGSPFAQARVDASSLSPRLRGESWREGIPYFLAVLREEFNPTPTISKALALFFTVVVAKGAVIAAAAPTPMLEGRIDRPLRYHPDGTEFVITNGAEFFNRPLYDDNTAFRVDAGDKPEFSLYLPGRGGNLRLGLKTATGSKWLFQADRVITRYQPGSMIYEITDALLGSGQLQLTVLTMDQTEGLVIRADLQGAPNRVELVWAFGGVNGQTGARGGDIGTERVPISEFFQLQPAFCRGNQFAITGSSFTLKSTPAEIAGIFPPGSKLAQADANKWGKIEELLASPGASAELPVMLGRVLLENGRTIFLALQRLAGGGRDQTGPFLTPYKYEALAKTFDSAEKHRAQMAGALLVETPDPYIDAAAAALGIAADGVWDERQGVVMHGAVAWRTKLAGWRGDYVPDEMGWHDRAERHFSYWAGTQKTNPIPARILPADPAENLARNEPSLHSNGDLSNSHYDMNLVFIDALFRHLLWTGDLNYARRMWPVIQRHLAWEQRLFRRPFGADGLPLYEAYAAIWASDDLAYEGGGAAHSTAYNYYHNKMAARLAKLLGENAAPYEHEAGLIAQAMHRELWLPDRGWFAEWKDYLGLQAVHPNAALWTFYHTVDSEVATPMEAWQMTRFIDTQIAHLPVRGPGVPAGYFTLPTTSWMPYTWSLNNVVMAEAQHTALGYWQAGRSDEAFRLCKGSLLDSMYLGLCPGNVGMCTWYDDNRRESQRDFADGIGMTSRALVEGLFGIHPDALAGELRIQPGFPAEWDRARLRHHDFDFAFLRAGLVETFTVQPTFPKPMALRLQAAALRDSVASVTVNGSPAKWRAMEESVGTPRVEIECPAAARFEVAITWQGEKPAQAENPAIAVRSGAMDTKLGAAQLQKIADPQGAVTNINFGANGFLGTAIGLQGHRTVFAQVKQKDMTWWAPVAFEVRPAYEIVPATRQDAAHLRFSVRNNTPQTLDLTADVHAGTGMVKTSLRAPALGSSEAIELTSNGLVPGSNPVSVDLGGGRVVEGVVENWNLSANAANSRLQEVDLTAFFNDRVTQIFENEYLSPRSPFCSLALPKQGIGSWCTPTVTFAVDDSGLRASAGKSGGQLLTPMGVPFQTPGPGQAKNIVFTSQWDNYPREMAVPLHGKAGHAWLLMAGSSNPMQSRFDNGEVIVAYADGTSERLALRNPTTWWPIDQDYFTDDFAFLRMEPMPPRVSLRTGQVRILDAASFKGKGGKVPGGAATILDMPLDPQKELKSLTVRTLANEVVIGLMAVTLEAADEK